MVGTPVDECSQVVIARHAPAGCGTLEAENARAGGEDGVVLVGLQRAVAGLETAHHIGQLARQ